MLQVLMDENNRLFLFFSALRHELTKKWVSPARGTLGKRASEKCFNSLRYEFFRYLLQGDIRETCIENVF